MPHVVATATGCHLEEAMTLLIYLYGKGIVDGYLLMYHSKHLDFPFNKQILQKGIPTKKSIFCQVCEENIAVKEILYDFEFVLNQDIHFQV
jgi:hypothetical protein